MIDFNKLAKDCMDYENPNEGIIKYISTFFSQEDYYIIVRKTDEKFEPIVGIMGDSPHLFVFTDETFAKETISKEIQDDEEKDILKYPMSSIYDYIKYLKDNGVKGICINYGEFGLSVNIEYVIQMYELLVLDKKGKEIQYGKGTKMKMGIPCNMEEIRDLITNNKNKLPELESLHLCFAIFEPESLNHEENQDSNEQNKYDRCFIVIPSFKEELSEIETKGVLFKIHSILSNITQKEDFKDCKISFYPNMTLIPEELFEQTKIL